MRTPGASIHRLGGASLVLAAAVRFGGVVLEVAVEIVPPP